MDWQNCSHKNLVNKSKKKTVNTEDKLPQVNKKKTPRRKIIFVQTLFSHSTSCLGVTKTTTPFDFKIMERCEQKTASQYNSDSLNCKKNKRRPIIALAIAVRLLIKDLILS